jgi:dephospho-CoA kinase
MSIGEKSMKIVGLTGGIGSGKSVVAELLQVYGIPVYNSDSRSKVLCQTNVELIEGLKVLFGMDVYLPDGNLNRPFMAKVIFEDKLMLQASNRLIHPVVSRDFTEWATWQDAPFVVQETAILFEAGLEKQYDVIICVTAPEELRIKRTCTRSGLNKEEVLVRMQNQLTEDERMRRSDIVLVNDEIEPLIPQIEDLIKKIANFVPTI